MIAAAAVDRPARDATVQRHGFAVEGWVLPESRSTVSQVSVEAKGETLGVTRMLFARSDVNAQLSLSADARTGFAVTCRVPSAMRTGDGLTFEVWVLEDDGTRTLIEDRSVMYSAFDYRGGGHGYLFDDGFDRVMHRNDVYATGPPSPLADPQCVDLLMRYLPVDSSVIDVGCGIGAYGHALTERRIRWKGCEVRPDFVDRARNDGLDVRLADGALPFPDDSFDAAIAVEVLEHIDDVHAFLSEVRRVAPVAYFSVPNFETIPITGSFYALPWHMLEPDHRNFFSSLSLSATLRAHFAWVEVLEYGPLPALRAPDGLPLHNHLFAIARSES